jgi:hypothetical protein
VNVLRWAFLVACFTCLVIVAWRGPWEGRLTQANHTWIVDLGRAPVWTPPADSSYARFREVFEASQGLPVEGGQGITIRRVLKMDWMATELFLYLWLVTLVSGLGYLAVRRERRSLILHLGLAVGIGLTVGAAGCIGLWLLIGGWGAPAPNFFGGLGLVLGVVVGLASFNREGTERVAARE